MASQTNEGILCSELGFTGKRVLVTGASRGIGRAIALRLSQLGADVVGLGSSAENLDSLKREQGASAVEVRRTSINCPHIQTVQVDISGWDATKRAIESVLPIDMLVNNAAILITEPFLDATEDSVDRTVAVNLKAVVNISQIVAKSLIQRKTPGSIVNVSSCAAKIAVPNHCIYASTKGALDALTRNMAMELGQYNIRVNGINPTVIATDMSMKAGWGDAKNSAPLLGRTPLHRFGELDDCANAVVFLLSDQAKYLTGVHLPVDGGLLAT